MFSLSPIAGRPGSRLTPLDLRRRRLAAALLFLTGTGFAAAQSYQNSQNYPQQQPYPAANAQMPGAPYGDSQQDPPSRVARLSVAQGNVSVQPANVQDFSAAEVNYPLTTGDRLWADSGALAELQIGQIAVRAGQQTDFTVTGLTDILAQFGMAQGSVHLRTFGVDPNTTTELDTPNASVTVLAAGDVRVDVPPGGNLTVVTLLSGAAQVDAPGGFSQQLRPGESLQVAGTEQQINARDVRRPRQDGLDGFSFGQDNAYESALAAENSYVSGDTIGAADLNNSGDWSADPEYGAVWFPRGVAVDWQPYRYGHWAYVGPWGWTWIAAEPWGFAPFHYGRWGQFRGRWGWIPGPVPVRPIYSPALVAFVGGGPGFGAGGGVTAWFPLGPREPYQPWYRSSDRYLTRVNVTNIYNRNYNEVRYQYAARGPSPFRPDPNRVYVNRPLATVAVPQGVFAGGRPVHNAALRVDPGRFANAPVLARPMASPTRDMEVHGPARALPPQTARPQLQTHGGGPGWQRPGGYQGGGQIGVQGGGQGGYGGGAQPAYIPRPTNRAQAPVQPNPGSSGQGGPQRPRGDNAGGQQYPGRNGSPSAPGSATGGTSGSTPGQGTPGRTGQQPGQQQPVQQPNQPQPAPQQPVLRPGGAPPAAQAPSNGGNPGYRAPVGPWRGTMQDPGQTGAPQQPGRQGFPAGPGQGAPRQPQPTQPQPAQPQPSQPQPAQRPVYAPPAGQAPQSPGFHGPVGPARGAPFDEGRPQPANNTPQNRPAAPPVQAIPRPAPQPQAQPQPSRQPPPATAPASAPAQPANRVPK